MVTIIAKFNVKSDCIDKFTRLALDCTRETRKERGNLSYRIFQARNDKSKFTFIEEWLNDTVIEHHNAAPHFKKFIDEITPLCEGEIEIEQIMKVPSAFA